ncbi:hypothetical protein DPMN_179256 [Dreissena polymorpha]|uniref:Uncharacterized protein n=1 Tax=Dreissena polymorpha TaxID=45954 RepID=A0A9D4EEE8_DREPO|nr:hypothetical protein DPMN_179256 [Dreissena polymorpha]
MDWCDIQILGVSEVRFLDLARYVGRRQESEPVHQISHLYTHDNLEKQIHT